MKKLLITATLLLLLSVKPLFAGVAKGVDVREVQTILTELCFNVGPIDGLWGKKTEKAAEAFFLKYFKKYSGHFGKGEMILLKSYEGHSIYEQCSKKLVKRFVSKQGDNSPINQVFNKAFKLSYKAYRKSIDESHSARILERLAAAGPQTDNFIFKGYSEAEIASARKVVKKNITKIKEYRRKHKNKLF